MFKRQSGKVNSGFVIKTQWRKRSLAKQICLPLCDFSSFLKREVRVASQEWTQNRQHSSWLST